MIKTTTDATDAVSEMLYTLGAQGVSIEDPADILESIQRPDSLDFADEEFITSLGNDVKIKAYFSESQNPMELRSKITSSLQHISCFLDIGKGSVQIADVDDEDWATSWKKYYKPFYLTNKILIQPSWEEYIHQGDEIVVTLDPGMAFGTGTHETTKMCSLYLEKYIQGSETVLDVGTGSGILSIVAAKFGASFVYSIDIDEVAVKVAEENISINRVNQVVNVEKFVIEKTERVKYQVVVANIIANVIIDIAQEVRDRLTDNGVFITSGIIKDRKQEVKDAYINLGFQLVDEMEMGEWVALVLQCQDSL